MSFLPYIRFSEKLLSKFMTFRNRKMPSMGLSVALQTSIYFRIICSQSASDVLCTPISKLGHNLHTLQLFQNCLTVTYRYHLHVGPLICSFRIQKNIFSKKTQSLQLVQLCFDCFQRSPSLNPSTGKHFQTPRNGAIMYHHTTCSYLTRSCANHQKNHVFSFSLHELSKTEKKRTRASCTVLKSRT